MEQTATAPAPTTTIRHDELKMLIKQDHWKQWNASTYINLGIGDKQLRVSTHKSTRGVLYTSAHTVTIKGDGFETWAIGSDYDATVKTFPEIKRVTQAAITIAHKASLEAIGPIVEAAKEYCAKKFKEEKSA